MGPADLSVFIVEAGAQSPPERNEQNDDLDQDLQGHCDLSERLGFPPGMCRRPHPITSSDTHMGSNREARDTDRARARSDDSDGRHSRHGALGNSDSMIATKTQLGQAANGK
jgi:hypothetical protein